MNATGTGAMELLLVLAGGVVLIAWCYLRKIRGRG